MKIRFRLCTALVLLGVVGTGCRDVVLASRTDTPPALSRVADSLTEEHFGGLVYVAQPSPGTLTLLVRDPSWCREVVSDLGRFAEAIARRALLLYRSPPLQRPVTLTRVEVVLKRTHRIGPVVWATTSGRHEFDASRLRAQPAQAAAHCGMPPALLKYLPDTEPSS
ncbi:MAG: hypothetical protein ABIZ91_13810 [Gemmatimonadaceae bacterium]